MNRCLSTPRKREERREKREERGEKREKRSEKRDKRREKREARRENGGRVLNLSGCRFTSPLLFSP